MCLLIAGKANQIRATLLNTKDLLKDIFDSNSDGVGAMYTTSKRKLRTPKVLPRNLDECAAFIRQLPDDDRSLALHFRMKTHGHIDLTNCHPYPVIEGKIAMMHNGVLSHGNKADPSKSDTWHYIKNVVRPILEASPKMFLNPGWMNLVESDISTGNRFAIMDSDGDMVILNKDTGIEHDGLWFSNTYAWSPELLIPGYAKPTKQSFYGGHWDFEDYGFSSQYGNSLGYNNPNVHRIPTTSPGVMGADKNGDAILEDDAKFSEDDIWNAVMSADADTMGDFLTWCPNYTLNTLFKDCEFVCEVDRELNKTDDEIVKLLADENVQELARLCISSGWRADQIAEVICWYGQWFGKAINADEDGAVATLDAEEQEAAQQELIALTAGATATDADYAG